MKIIANRGVCKGHGQCELFAPHVFALDDEAIVVLKVDQVGASDEDAVHDAISHCPESAIRAEQD